MAEPKLPRTALYAVFERGFSAPEPDRPTESFDELDGEAAKFDRVWTCFDDPAVIMPIPENNPLPG